MNSQQNSTLTNTIVKCFLLAGCQFYPPGEYLRFVRVPENLKIGDEVLRVEVHPRNDLTLLPVDKVSLFIQSLKTMFNKTLNNCLKYLVPVSRINN